jgi:hypothetical protein
MCCECSASQYDLSCARSRDPALDALFEYRQAHAAPRRAGLRRVALPRRSRLAASSSASAEPAYGEWLFISIQAVTFCSSAHKGT